MDALDTGYWPQPLRQFESLSDELEVQDGILIRAGCVVVPETLRQKALAIAHEGHPSAAKLKSILRERVWWPNMNKDAVDWVESCAVCATNGRPEKPTPMQRFLAPKNVWETIALDFNGPYSNFGGISILVIVDYRSRFVIAKPVKSTSFEQTKKVLDSVFEKEGFPQCMKSDNGPPFNGDDYRQYCSERGIKTIFSTPLYPQQNGLAEVCMKLVNKSMIAATTNKTNYIDELNAAVHAHNAAAHAVTKIPPEEVMMRRKVRRGLPLVRPGHSSFEDDDLDARDRKSKLLAKEREDQKRGARECRVKMGDFVVVERQNRAKGESRFHPCKYCVTEENNGMLVLCDDAGKVLKRHVSQTRKVGEWRSNGSESVEEKEGTTQQETNCQQRQDQEPNRCTAPIQRPGREKRAPGHLKDFVLAAEQQ